MQPKTVVRRSQIAQYVGPRVAETDHILSVANVSQMVSCVTCVNKTTQSAHTSTNVQQKEKDRKLENPSKIELI